MGDKAPDTAEVVVAVAVGTLVVVVVAMGTLMVAWRLIKLAVGVGASVVWGLTKLVSSSSSSSGLEKELDTEDTHKIMSEANDGRVDRWSFPDCGKLKMNTDGSVKDSQKDNGGPAGFGVVIRDESGSWIRGYYGRLMKNCSSVEAEVWAIYNGLQIIQGRHDHFAKVFEIESDCEPAVNLIKSKTHTKKPSIKEKVEECKKMLERMTGCKLEHIGNKANKVGDEMANLGRDQDEEFVPFSSPPDQKIERFLESDVANARSV